MEFKKKIYNNDCEAFGISYYLNRGAACSLTSDIKCQICGKPIVKYICQFENTLNNRHWNKKCKEETYCFYSRPGKRNKISYYSYRNHKGELKIKTYLNPKYGPQCIFKIKCDLQGDIVCKNPLCLEIWEWKFKKRLTKEDKITYLALPDDYREIFMLKLFFEKEMKEWKRKLKEQVRV